MHVLDVPAVEVGSSLLLDGCSFAKDETALLLFDLDVGQSHLLVQLLDATLHLEDLSLALLLFSQSLHHQARQLLPQVLSLPSLRLHPCFCPADRLFQRQALVLPLPATRGGSQGRTVPHGLPAELEPDDIFTNFCKFVPTSTLIGKAIAEVVLETFVLLGHHCIQVIQLLLLPDNCLLHHCLRL